MARPNPKYELIITLAKYKFTPEEITLLTLDDVKETKIKGKNIGKAAQELLRKYLAKPLPSQYLFPGKNLGQADPGRLVIAIEGALKAKGMTLEDIGWQRVPVGSAPKLNTLESIMEYAKKVKEGSQ